MKFFEYLYEQTKEEQHYLLSAPIIERCFQGHISIGDYVAFLQQAYHHVKHTTPLLMNVGAKLPENKEWLREGVAEYIEEELGHQEWILNDIARCGYDKEQVRKGKPLFETELMVSYTYDAINRKSPLCFFGLVHVLEGTSVILADRAATIIGEKLQLPENAFSYLRSHGALDLSHVKFFESLMNNITDKNEQQLIVDATKIFYRLYGDMLRALTPQHGIAQAA